MAQIYYVFYCYTTFFSLHGGQLRSVKWCAWAPSTFSISLSNLRVRKPRCTPWCHIGCSHTIGCPEFNFVCDVASFFEIYRVHEILSCFLISIFSHFCTAMSFSLNWNGRHGHMRFSCSFNRPIRQNNVIPSRMRWVTPCLVCAINADHVSSVSPTSMPFTRIVWQRSAVCTGLDHWTLLVAKEPGLDGPLLGLQRSDRRTLRLVSSHVADCNVLSDVPLYETLHEVASKLLQDAWLLQPTKCGRPSNIVRFTTYSS